MAHDLCMTKKLKVYKNHQRRTNSTEYHRQEDNLAQISRKWTFNPQSREKNFEAVDFFARDFQTERHGTERLQPLCKSVKRSFYHRIRHFCGPSAGRIAATGEKISNCLHIESYDFHKKFYSPFLALWITVHISELETTRHNKGSKRSNDDGIQRISCLYRQLIVFYQILQEEQPIAGFWFVGWSQCLINKSSIWNTHTYRCGWFE